MGFIILHDAKKDYACFVCTTSDTAFGPLIFPDRELGKVAEEMAEYFLRYLRSKGVADPRGLNALDTHYMQFLGSIEQGGRACEIPNCTVWLDDMEGAICTECKNHVCGLHHFKTPCNVKVCEDCTDLHQGECRTCQDDAKDERLWERRKERLEDSI